MTKFQEQFRKARNCGIPLISARSADPVSTVQSICTALNGKSDNVPLMQWDVLRGINGLNECGKLAVASMLDGADPAQVSARPTDVLGLLQKTPEDAIVLMHNLHLFWNDSPTLQGILNLRDGYKAIGAMLVGLTLTGSELPAELSEHTLVIDEPLPTPEELADLTREIFRAAGLSEPAQDCIARACDATQGLSAFAAEQSLSLNMSKQGLDVTGTWKRKRQMIESDGLLKVYEGPENFRTVGGNAGFKDFQQKLFNGIDRPRGAILFDEIEKAIATDSGNSTMTQLLGILLSWFQDKKIDGQLLNGVPGAGKTSGVKACANEFAVPLVLFNVSSMQNQFVGNSQKRLITALDRIDSMLGGKPVVFATCNKLETLSPELKSRFKLATFFFDLPSADERLAIWEIYFRKYFPNLAFDSASLPACDGWTGREIEECCYKAYRLSLPVTDSARYIVPVARAASDTIKALRQQASGKFLAASETGLYRYEETASVSSGRKFRE